jgi:hypothetical protein
VGVQLVEHTPFGVRSAVLTFERRGSGVRFVVVPMLHIGSPAFFDAVRQRLASCDVVVAEGVPGVRARVITLAYRVGGRLRRDGLVEQGRALDLSALDAEIVRPDLSSKEFGVGWHGVRWWIRVAIYIGAPLFGVWMAIVGPRRALSHRLTVDDEISLDEFEAMGGGLSEALVDQRDRALCAALVELAEDDAAAPRTIGVCWGATHVRAISDTLHTDLGFRITDASWVTVF